ncbi:glycosyltransferase [Leptolyngbya sp. CCNP1308]|uniref:glycosyltransferase n=1 Tax=Leptolyngbya sp. CCNP1308 TaxID=3110255 RepID=UPI002B21E3FC|nr:glycosyltransferase [Leptolyngbya sp. CCNP1308]MEA5448471.1 glycosyltransferase [Leptolyngbya sp. CCNP1308]
MPDVAIFLMDLRGGGAEKVMLNIANGLAAKGLEIDLVLVQTKGEYIKQISAQVNLVELSCSRLISALPALVSYLKKYQPTALLSALEDTNIIAILAKLFANSSSRTVVTVHNHLAHEISHSKNLKRKLVPHLLRWIYPYADAVVGVSQGVVDNLIDFGVAKHKTFKIYNPIITPDLVEKSSDQLEQPLFQLDQRPVILGVGRLTRQKDFQTLIFALKAVREVLSAHLVILGDGEDRAQLVDLVHQLGLQDAVTFLGFVSNPYVFMREADVFVLSSAWEGFGNVLVEAMFSGTPVVSTNCESGPAEILADGKYGHLVAVGHAEAMAQAIVDTLQKKSVSPEVLKQRASTFSLENSLAKYMELLKV